MGRHHSLRRAARWALVTALLLITVASLSQGITHAQSKSASIISLNTDKATYNSGETVTIALVVRNTGDSSTQIQCNIIVFDSAGKQIYSYSRKYDLSPGATSNYEFYWTVPSNSPSGSYQVQTTIADGNDGRFYSSRSTNFTRSSPSQSPRSASLLELAVNNNSYLPGEVSTITVFMQNTGGSDISVVTAVDVINPSGIQVFNGVRESRVDRGYTDKVSFTLPIPNNAAAGTYQVQATIADRSDGKLYGTKSATLYVQPTVNAGMVTNNSAAGKGIQLPNPGFSGWGQYLITGLLLALAAIVIYILIRNRPRKREVTVDTGLPAIPSDEGKPEEPE